MRRPPDTATVRFWAKWCGGLLLALMLRVWEHVEAERMVRRLDVLRGETDRLVYENGRLQMQIHQWVAPSHLDAMARQQYGMKPLGASQIIGIQP